MYRIRLYAEEKAEARKRKYYNDFLAGQCDQDVAIDKVQIQRCLK